MKTLMWALVAACVSWPAGGQDTKTKKKSAGDLEAELSKVVADFDKDGGGFCGSVLVAAKGKVLLEKGYGAADKKADKSIGADALWDWASVTKQFTAAAVLKLQDQKKLKLDDPISKFFKDAPEDKAKVTLRQILNHTSGIEAGFGEGEKWQCDSRKRESFEEMILKLPMTSKPGEKWEYSNSGYGFAAAIVERVSGKTFEQFCVDEIFKPAGMKDAAFIGWDKLDLARVPKIDRGEGFTDGRPKDFAFAYGNTLTWGYRGCGGAVASTRDMFQWDQALRGDKVLSKAAKGEYYKTGLKDYALGWFVNETPRGARVEHSGGVKGVVVDYVRLLDEDIVVAIACSYEPKENPNNLADALIEIARRAK